MREVTLKKSGIAWHLATKYSNFDFLSGRHGTSDLCTYTMCVFKGAVSVSLITAILGFVGGLLAWHAALAVSGMFIEPVTFAVGALMILLCIAVVGAAIGVGLLFDKAQCSTVLKVRSSAKRTNHGVNGPV